MEVRKVEYVKGDIILKEISEELRIFLLKREFYIIIN